MKQTEINNIKVISKKLDNACFIEFGTRVVQKKDGGDVYPVYGGGGATFKMNTYNRENCLVVSRFAMSKQCTRFVEGKFYLNDSGLTVRPKNEKELTQEYLDYLLLTLNDTIYSLSRGTAQRNLNVSKFRNLEIKYPDSIELQLHIANLLSKAENLIAQRKESIRLLDEFLKSTFLEMFGDPVKNEKGWKKVCLGGVCRKIGSGSTPRGGKESYHKEGISLIRSLNVHNDEFVYKDLAFIDDTQAHELKNVIVEENDVLLNITGASVARCCIVPKEILPARVNQHVSILRPDTNVLNQLFLSRMLTSENYQLKLVKDAKSKGATREAITKEELELMNVIAPPFALQTQFAQIVEKTEALKTQYQQGLHELENLYGSLSQKAFRGELNIKDESLLGSADHGRSMAAERSRSKDAGHGRSMDAERSRSMAAEHDRSKDAERSRSKDAERSRSKAAETEPKYEKNK